MPEDEAALRIALYTDADISPELARQLRARGYDAISAREIDNLRLSDRAQLAFAVSHKRTLLSFNAKHFAPLVEEYWNAGRDHYGVVISEQLPLGELLRRVVNLLQTVSSEEIENNFRNLGEFVERE